MAHSSRLVAFSLGLAGVVGSVVGLRAARTPEGANCSLILGASSFLLATVSLL